MKRPTTADQHAYAFLSDTVELNYVEDYYVEDFIFDKMIDRSVYVTRCN